MHYLCGADKNVQSCGDSNLSIIVPNSEIRKFVHRGINTDEVAESNAFAIEATISAFSNGEILAASLNGISYGE